MNVFAWLEEWYKSSCNGEWEEDYGIKIQTIDNPGWLVIIDILETDLEEKEFVPLNIEFVTAIVKKNFLTKLLFK